MFFRVDYMKKNINISTQERLMKQMNTTQTIASVVKSIIAETGCEDGFLTDEHVVAIIEVLGFEPTQEQWLEVGLDCWFFIG